MATTRLMTAEDLWAMGDDAKHCELYQGVFVCDTPPMRKSSRVRHAQVSGMVLTYLNMYASSRREHDVFSGAGYVLARDSDVVLAPDVSVVRSNRFPDAGPGEPPRTLTSDDESDGGDALPGFSTPAASFFERWLRPQS